MKKINLLLIALVVSMATCSQSRGRRTQTEGEGREPLEIKQSIFFADGTLDEYTTSEWDSSYSHVNNQERYSASGAMLEQIEYQYNVDNGYITIKLVMDVERRLKNRVTYQYQQNRLWRETLADNKGKPVSTYEYVYDNNGNRVSRIIRNRAGDKLAETAYTFDNQGRMIKSQTRDYSESAISSTDYQYDAQGNLVRQVVLNNDGKPTTTINVVWQGGHEVRNETLSVDGTIQMCVTSEYGENGELVRKIIENFQGASKQIMQYEYTFRPARRQS